MNSSALLALLLPAALVLSVRALFALGRGRPFFAFRDAATALAAGVAIPAALFLLGVRPGLPLGASEDGWAWLVWLAPAGALLGVAEAWPRLPRLVSLLVAAGGSCLAAGLLLSPLPAGAHPLVGALALLALWIALARPVGEDRRRAIAASVLVAALGAAPILFRGAHSMSLSGVAAVCASAILGAVASIHRGVAPLPRALAGVGAMALGGCLLAANAYQRVGDFDGFPVVSALSLGAAAAAGAFVPTRLGRVLSPALAGGVALLLAAVSAWTCGAFEPYDTSWW